MSSRNTLPRGLWLALSFSTQVAHAQVSAAAAGSAAQKAPQQNTAMQNGAPFSEEPEPGSRAEASDANARRASLREQNAVSGSTGLLHLVQPSSGAAGTFRVSLLADWSSGTGFLCTSSTPCGNDTRDSASRFGSVLGLSLTPVRFLEAYGSLHSSASSDDQHSPGLIDVLGNAALGAKLFTADPIAGLLSLGGAAELELLNGSGSVGVNGKGTSFRLSALAGLDLRGAQGSGPPLRILSNLGYVVDNSGNLVDATESSRGTRITRVERFGLGINRVDRFQAGLGVEALFPVLRPFVEWNLELPVNRQNYVCSSATRYSGDQCLANDQSLSAFPSSLTLGVRVAPFLKGLSATAALDIGTSGTSNFIEELAPTLPWDAWLGVGYAFDIQEPKPEQVRVVERVTEALPPKPSLKVRGSVHEHGKDTGIANAILHYQGRELTAMASGADGHFVSGELEPGAYTFGVEAENFKPGECSVVIPEEPAAKAPAPAAPIPPAAASGAPAPAAGVHYFDVDCELEALPRAGNVNGAVLDADSSSPVAGATVELVDSLGRSLQLETDAGGSFRFERVLPGMITLKADAQSYLFHSQTLELLQRQDAHAQISLRKRPKAGHVVVAANELRLNQQIHFEQDSATILPDSQALLEEIADALAGAPRISHVEIQGHTDNNGTPEHNKALSEARANAVLDWLTSHGIDPSRLAAHGYGQERPMSPNVTPQARARNRRVQFMILDQSAPGAPRTPH
jgi:outer membrane protein OmpA-like peptidoglycan-associated protein/methionine-rich copper-binding protein CopC